MGKERELFDAARNGNSTFFQKLLFSKNKSIPLVQSLVHFKISYLGLFVSLLK